MKIQIIFEGSERREFETTGFDESIFSRDKIQELKAMLTGLETVIGSGLPEPLFSQRLVPKLTARIKELEAELEMHRMRVG